MAGLLSFLPTLASASANLLQGDNCQNDFQGALESNINALRMARILVNHDPDNVVWIRDVSISLSKIGRIHVDLGNLDSAAEAYLEDLQIARKLAKLGPNNARWQTDLIVSLYTTADFVDIKEQREMLSEALSIAQFLQSERKLTAQQNNWPELIRRRLSDLDSAE